MTSPQGKSLDRQAETVERRLIKWAVADVHPQNAAGKIASEARRLEVRGREKLIRRLGIKRLRRLSMKENWLLFVPGNSSVSREVSGRPTKK